MPTKTTPIKLTTIAKNSNETGLSPIMTHDRKAVQNGAVLKIVICTTIGTIAIAKIIAVRPEPDNTDLQKIHFRLLGLTHKFSPSIKVKSNETIANTNMLIHMRSNGFMSKLFTAYLIDMM